MKPYNPSWLAWLWNVILVNMIDCIGLQSHEKTQKHIMHCKLQLRKMFTGTKFFFVSFHQL